MVKRPQNVDRQLTASKFSFLFYTMFFFGTTKLALPVFFFFIAHNNGNVNERQLNRQKPNYTMYRYLLFLWSALGALGKKRILLIQKKVVR